TWCRARASRPPRTRASASPSATPIRPRPAWARRTAAAPAGATPAARARRRAPICTRRSPIRCGRGRARPARQTAEAAPRSEHRAIDETPAAPPFLVRGRNLPIAWTAVGLVLFAAALVLVGFRHTFDWDLPLASIPALPL